MDDDDKERGFRSRVSDEPQVIPTLYGAAAVRQSFDKTEFFLIFRSLESINRCRHVTTDKSEDEAKRLGFAISIPDNWKR